MCNHCKLWRNCLQTNEAYFRDVILITKPIVCSSCDRTRKNNDSSRARSYRAHLNGKITHVCIKYFSCVQKIEETEIRTIVARSIFWLNVINFGKQWKIAATHLNWMTLHNIAQTIDWKVYFNFMYVLCFTEIRKEIPERIGWSTKNIPTNTVRICLVSCPQRFSIRH